MIVLHWRLVFCLQEYCVYTVFKNTVRATAFNTTVCTAFKTTVCPAFNNTVCPSFNSTTLGNAWYINYAEHHVILKGINMARQLKVTVLHLVTDSAKAYHWIADTLNGIAQVNTRVACEMLIRRWLETLHALIKAYDLVMDMKLVMPVQNKTNFY